MKKVLTLTLDRIAKKPTYTIGKLYIAGKYFCDTLEDAVRALKDLNADGDFNDPGEGKVCGQTAIPEGTYRVVLTASSRFKRVMPQLLDVPGYSGVRIHAGNNAEHTEGCILTGMNKVVGGLVESRVWTEALYAKLHGYISDGYEVYITIK